MYSLYSCWPGLVTEAWPRAGRSSPHWSALAQSRPGAEILSTKSMSAEANRNNLECPIQGMFCSRIDVIDQRVNMLATDVQMYVMYVRLDHNDCKSTLSLCCWLVVTTHVMLVTWRVAEWGAPSLTPRRPHPVTVPRVPGSSSSEAGGRQMEPILARGFTCNAMFHPL